MFTFDLKKIKYHTQYLCVKHILEKNWHNINIIYD